MAAIPVSNIFGAPLSGLILGVNWFGIAGWRWVFILEGIPAVILGIATDFLSDRPTEGREMARRRRAGVDFRRTRKGKTNSQKPPHRSSIWQALRHRNVILLTLGYFCAVTSAYGFNFWFPTIVKRSVRLFEFSGFADRRASVYLPDLSRCSLVGWSSDRTRERRWHTSLSLLAVCFGLLFGALLSENIFLAVPMFCIACAGLYSYLPGFWALPGTFLTEAAAAVSIGFINSVGNLGGFFGPYIVGLFGQKNRFVLFGNHLSYRARRWRGAILILMVKHSSKTSL